MSGKYKQTILSDGDLTTIIQNTFERPIGQIEGEFSVEVWNVIMTSPHLESGMYRRERVKSFDAAIEMARDQYYEEFGCEIPLGEILAKLKRIDF